MSPGALLETAHRYDFLILLSLFFLRGALDFLEDAVRAAFRVLASFTGSYYEFRSEVARQRQRHQDDQVRRRGRLGTGYR